MRSIPSIMLTVLFLSSCTGLGREEVRQLPSKEFTSTKSVGVITRCLTDKLNYLLPDRMVIIPNTDTGEIEFNIGVTQFTELKYYHRILVSKNNNHTNISLQSAEKYFSALPYRDAMDVINSCL